MAIIGLDLGAISSFLRSKRGLLTGIHSTSEKTLYSGTHQEEYLGDGINRCDDKWTKSNVACPVKSGGFI